MGTREPETEHGRQLKARVSEQRWHRVVAEAEERAAIVDAVRARRDEQGLSWRKAVQAVAPQTQWPTFVNYKRRYEARTGESWERLLDGRVPPDRSKAERIRGACCMMRQMDPEIGVEEAREQLQRLFGEEGEVSDAWLRRVWAEAGLARPVGGRAGEPVAETVQLYHGGGGLALIGAAEAEVGSTARLAASVGAQAELLEVMAPKPQEGVRPPDALGRDEEGRFTKAYNERRREGVAPSTADDRWDTDKAKASRRNLLSLRMMSAKPETVQAKLLTMGSTPLLTERRGFDGLDGPAGAWLGVYGCTAYMPTTLDKALAELAQMSVDDLIWQTHARTWSEVSARWRQVQDNWQRVVLYVDGTADPYWTRAFAMSGKVSKLNRVMPCVSRVAIHSGEGVPILVATFAGAAPLKRHLVALIERLSKAIGPTAAVQRLTVVDSEAGTAGLMWAMHEQPDMLFITVIKGRILQGATVIDPDEWQSYRKRDQVRNVRVYVDGKDAPKHGIVIRGVQLQRSDGRREQTTLFATNASTEDLTAAQVADLYLARWPKQEQAFRNGRDGGGLNRSHGFGGQYVTNVALPDKLAKAHNSTARAEASHAQAQATQKELKAALKNAPAKARRAALDLAKKDARNKGKTHKSRQQAQARLATLPEQIYERDLGRDSIMTCLKLNILTLLEFVMQEYFGHQRMEWRTFIEHYVPMPVTVRTSRHRVVFQLHANPRQPERMAQLAAALAEVTRRRIRRGKRVLVFELLEPPDDGS